MSQLDALLTHLGTGRWSLLHFLTLSYTSMFLAPHSFGGALLAPLLDYSCRVPTDTNTTTFTTLLQDNTSSYTPIDEKCEYRIHTPDGDRIEECQEFHFDNSSFSSTLTSEYNLACGQAYIQTSFQSIYMLGTFLGGPFIGFMADKYGRRTVYRASVLFYLGMGIASSWFPVLSTILMARLAMGFVYGGCSFNGYVLLMEITEPKLRPVFGYLIYMVYALSTTMYGVFGYFIREWRMLQTVMTLPGLLILTSLWLIDESPRWLIVKGHKEEAQRMFEKVARWHGVDLLPEAQMNKLIEEQTLMAQGTPQHSFWQVIKTEMKEILVLFRTPRLRTITFCVFLNYFVAGMVYFGLALSGSLISNDPYMYIVLMGLMQIPGYSLPIFIAKYFGRKPTLILCFLITACVLFALPFIKADNYTINIILAMIGQMAITGGFQTIILLSSEVFPTEVRGRSVSLSYMMDRIGGVVAPFITDLVGIIYPWSPFVIFALGSLLAAAVTLLLPETCGQILPDTVIQLEDRLKKESRLRDLEGVSERV